MGFPKCFTYKTSMASTMETTTILPAEETMASTKETTTLPVEETMASNNNNDVVGLLGPPELHTNISTTNATAATPALGFTEKNSLTYTATGDACLDFFFHVVPDTSSSSITKRLKQAWDLDPLTTLKLMCNLRAVRGTGKSNKEGFFSCVFWLHKHHPKTLAYNLKSLAKFGCFKDLVEILFRLLEGADVRAKRKYAWESKKNGQGKSRNSHKMIGVPRFRRKKNLHKKKSTKKSREDRMRKDMERGEEVKAKARELRKVRELAKAKKAVARYSEDPDYRVLHDKVAEAFAYYLRSDAKKLSSGEVSEISLASKWCPNLDSAYDKTILICESIARRVFPRAEYPEYDGVEDAHYAYRVRDRLRKEVLVPLRKVLELPEVHMGANQWRTLPYNRVPSVAMQRYKDLFLKHDPKRFLKYLDDVKKGDAKLAAGALLPHEIIKSFRSDDSEVPELQWKRMVEDLTKLGKLSNCIAVCDVSGSMEGTPLDVCISLGLLISELSEDPWKGKVITFSERPELHLIEGDDFSTKINFMDKMEAGANTDFQRVFDQILRVAVEGNLEQDKMVKRVFVFTDMEFDKASRPVSYYSYSDYSSSHPPKRKRTSYWYPSYSSYDSLSPKSRYGSYSSDYSSSSYSSDDSDYSDVSHARRAEECRKEGWETDYEAIKRKFKEKGYDKVPEIVFWNLRDSKATPVTAYQDGVVLMSGFSKNLLKLFFKNDGVFTPMEALQAAISGEEYQELQVYD